jgi:formylglycine-generating enzyme required for sulfatase activity
MLSDPNRYQKKLKEKLQFAEGTPLEARLRLGLLPTDPRHAGRLVEQVLEAPANEISYLIESLRPYSEQAVERWWIAAKQVDSRQLLPAAAGLARFCKDSPYWQEISQATAQALIEKNGTERLVWEDLLRPAACHWLPHAVAMLQDPKTDAEWKMATQLVLNHASDPVELLRTVLLEGHPEEFRHAFSRYENRGLKAIEELFDEWRSDIPSPEAVGEREHSRRQRRKRMAAIALFQAGGQALLDTLPADPRNLDSSAHFANDARNRITKPDLFIDLLHRLGALAVPQETTRREVQSLQLYTLLLTIGEMSWEEVPDRRKEDVVSLLVSLYGNHPSRAVHSAAGWLLQRWNQIEGMRKIEQTAIPFDSTGYRQWYVLKIDPGKYEGLPEMVDHSTPQGLQPIDIQAPFYVTMIAFFPPDTIPANDHQRSQPKSPFAISDREVSWRWFSSVDGDEGRRQILEQKSFRNRSQLAADEPVLRTSWLEAIDTLRWMTKGIGLPENEQCYQAGYSHETGIPIPGKQGLRLPSLAEWRWAVDAKNYRFGYGNDPSLLHRYAWFRDNSANRWHPVANLRPSFHGLFDMEGNVSEWLNDPYSNDTADDDRPNQANTGNPPRCFRGGNWDSPATLCDNQANATEMFGASPGERNSLRGFRLAQSPSSDKPQALIPKSNGNPDG